MYDETHAQESRRESFERAEPHETTLGKKILEHLGINGEKTAFELSDEMNVPVLTVRPILTKMASTRYCKGKPQLEERGRKKVPHSRTKVTVYGLEGGLF